MNIKLKNTPEEIREAFYEAIKIEGHKHLPILIAEIRHRCTTYDRALTMMDSVKAKKKFKRLMKSVFEGKPYWKRIDSYLNKPINKRQLREDLTDLKNANNRIGHKPNPRRSMRYGYDTDK